ncbi:MAG: hypothetical protein ACK4M5_13450, partial [Dietzia cercidiphylli]
RPLPEGPVHLAVAESLRGGALFFRDVVAAVKEAAQESTGDTPEVAGPAPTGPAVTGPAPTGPAITEAVVRDALWDLVWDGVVTNDT